MADEPPLVASIWMRLAPHARKHPYSFKHSLRVDAPYRVLCAPAEDCEKIRLVREQLKLQTEVVPWSISLLTEALAREAGVARADLEEAARLSVTPVHCPSAELVLIWLAKPLAVLLAMRAHPERQRFAWLDAAFNVYRVKQEPPPPPPWRTFWPANGTTQCDRSPELATMACAAQATRPARREPFCSVGGRRGCGSPGSTSLASAISSSRCCEAAPPLPLRAQRDSRFSAPSRTFCRM